jgi:hypothetical protein
MTKKSKININLFGFLGSGISGFLLVIGFLLVSSKVDEQLGIKMLYAGFFFLLVFGFLGVFGILKRQEVFKQPR